MMMTKARSEARDVAVAAEEPPSGRRRFGLRRVGSKARELNERAQAGARRQIERRRNAAADTLLGLASAIRPTQALRAARRRKALAIAGGSGLVLTAALGAGVAIGFLLSRQLKRRAERRNAAAGADGTATSTGMGTGMGQDASVGVPP